MKESYIYTLFLAAVFLSMAFARESSQVKGPHSDAGGAIGRLRQSTGNLKLPADEMDSPKAFFTESPSSYTSIASYLQLTPYPKLQVPVNFAVVLVGFDGEGGEGLTLDFTGFPLEEWLQHLQHTRPHVVAPSQFVEDTVKDAIVSNVSYRYDLEVVYAKYGIAEKLWKLMRDHLRHEEPGDHATSPRHYIRAPYILEFLQREGLTHHNLTSTNTLFVLNPPADLVNVKLGETYGYRFGLSNSELYELAMETLTNNTKEGFQDSSRFSNKPTLTASGEVSTRYLAHHLTQYGTAEEKDMIARARVDPYMWEECTTDLYQSDTYKLAFVDLRAGPFEWGPVIDGTGIHRGPRVDLKLLKTDPFAGPSKSNRRLLHREDIGEDHDEMRGEEGEESGHQESDSMFDMDFWLRIYESDCVQKDGQMSMTDFCQSVLSKIAEGRRYGAAAEDDDHAVHNHRALEKTGRSLGYHKFLAQFGKLISQTLAHIVTPTVAHLPGGQRVSSPLSVPPKHVHTRYGFHIYVISNHDNFAPLSVSTLNIEAVKRSVKRMLSPTFEFDFKVHKMRIEDDPVVAMAFYRSLRTTTYSAVRITGQYNTQPRAYLDSDELHHQLSLTTMENDGLKHKDIPIFLFSMDIGMPLFIDTHYRSRSLDDMIIAVQSDFPQWESHLYCNTKPVYFNLRDPLNPIVMSIMRFIGGVLPTHIAFLPESNRLTQNWLWGLGERAPTQFQIEVMHRNLLMHALQLSHTMMNDGVRTLSNVPVSDKTHAEVLDQSALAKDLFVIQAHIRQIWESMIHKMRYGQYDQVMNIANELTYTASVFNESCSFLADDLHHAHCKPATFALPARLYVHFGVLVAVLLGVILYGIFFRGRRRKVKFN